MWVQGAAIEGLGSLFQPLARIPERWGIVSDHPHGVYGFVAVGTDLLWVGSGDHLGLFTHWQARRKEEITVEHYPGTTPVESGSSTQVDQATEQAKQQSQQLAHQARYQARRASGGFERMVRENPLAMGALAVGAGAALGLAIPQSTQEHEVMGEARDTFVEKAQEKAQDAQQRVQRVAQEAQSAAKEEASNQGLTDQ
jgi:hypothetical protein